MQHNKAWSSLIAEQFYCPLFYDLSSAGSEVWKRNKVYNAKGVTLDSKSSWNVFQIFLTSDYLGAA